MDAEILAWNPNGTPIMLPEKTTMYDVVASIYLDKMQTGSADDKQFYTNFMIHGRLHRMQFKIEPIGFHETLQGTN